MEPTVSNRRPAPRLRRFLTAPFRRQTYSNLLYLALTFPLGIVYFVGLVTGATTGFALLITWVGLPLLLVTLAGATAAAGLEARLASRLVGVDATVPAVLREFDPRDGLAFPGNGFRAAITRLLTAPSTWTGVSLVFTKFVFGLFSFVALVTVATVGVVMLAAPVLYDGLLSTSGVLAGPAVVRYTVGSWVVETLPEALVVAAGGLVVLSLGISVLDALARSQAQYTALLLGVDER